VISLSAQEALSALFTKSVEEAIHQRSDAEQWEIQYFPTLENTSAKEFFILTTCSFNFRLFNTFHFTYHQPTIAYVANILETSEELLTREQFYDCLSEYANGYCGTIKRAMGKIFPYLSMSTPNLLNQQSFQFLESLKYEYKQYSLAVSQNNVSLLFGVYFSPHEDLDFTASDVIEDEVAHGELELF